MSALLDSILPDTEGSVFAAALPQYSVISAAGSDALTFLHGQLTQDVTGLPADAARLAGYCTAKGRLLATLIMWRASGEPADATMPTELYALTRQDVAAALVKRLSMFVLRAKAKLAITSFDTIGVWARPDDVASLEAAAGGTLPTTPWQRRDLPSGTWIAAPSADTSARWWWIANNADADADKTSALTALMQRGSADQWQHAEQAAGLPWVTAATQDLFIPQTLNLDLIDGVNFTKGCYPGQEIVARSHYRGTVKRRTAYGEWESATEPFAPGTDIFDANQPEDPCGRIVESTPLSALFEIPLATLDEGDLRVGSADGVKITVKPLPYNLADGGFKR